MSVSSYQNILDILKPYGSRLVAVSKTKSVEEIRELYNQGQRDFGENYVQELMEKETALPKDIRWHFIGHLQTNKVKFIAPFIYMIQSVDSLKLLHEIDKQAAKNQRVIFCLLQIFIAREETKFGMNETELDSLIITVNQNRQNEKFSHSLISGCMGMASLTENQALIHDEFKRLREIFEKIKTSFPSDPVDTLSMGMSNDYLIALEMGSSMVRIGSLIFGKR
ncbi:MAG TPA: YggS family pyridoxal phosphate-dependent enzyme [Puia sp.]|jgi:pyridoxal phosphate enzyme (YggS family)|nr:YggS family pyridoxal phosphate-dependent enzyme [Puia sp.]